MVSRHHHQYLGTAKHCGDFVIAELCSLARLLTEMFPVEEFFPRIGPGFLWKSTYKDFIRFNCRNIVGVRMISHKDQRDVRKPQARPYFAIITSNTSSLPVCPALGL